MLLVCIKCLLFWNQVRHCLVKFTITILCDFLFRIKSFTFKEQGMIVDLPKVLANGNIAVRILYTKYDNLSYLAKSYYPKAKKPVVAKPSGAVKGEVKENNEPFAVGGHVTITTLNQSAMTKYHPEMERAG